MKGLFTASRDSSCWLSEEAGWGGGAGRDGDEGRSSSESVIKIHLIEIAGHYETRSRVLQRRLQVAA